MGRRDEEDLPAVEVLGAEGPVSSLQTVSTRGPDGPRRGRVLGLIVGAVVVSLLVGGVLLGGDDDVPEESAAKEQTTTTRPRTTTTRSRSTTTSITTTTTAAPVPLFAGQVLRGWLLSGSADGWTLVDIESGATLDSGLPFDDPYSTRPVAGGVVMISSGEARFHDLRVPADAREPVSLGPSDQILNTVDGDKVWLIEGTSESVPGAARARLVGVDGQELRSFQLPPEVFSTLQMGPNAATTDGLVFARGGRVYLVNEAGVHAIAIGELLGAVESSVFVFSCDQAAASCGVDLRAPSGALIRRLDVEQPATPTGGTTVSSADDGRLALVTQHYSENGDGTVITLLEPDGRTIATMEAMGYMPGVISWLPNDAGLVGSLDGGIVWIHTTSEGWVVEPLPGMSVQSEGVLAITLP
jgi:hypothetical protein